MADSYLDAICAASWWNYREVATIPREVAWASAKTARREDERDLPVKIGPLRMELVKRWPGAPDRPEAYLWETSGHVRRLDG